jgi:hypothetical protein
MPYRYRYNPNQPRVPAGHSDGGQWTDSGSRGGRHTRIEPQTSPFFELGLQELHRRGAQSMTDVSARARRLLPWRAFPVPTKPPPLFEPGAGAAMPPGAHPARKDVESALALYNELSLHNSPEQRAVIAFRAGDYRRGEALEVTFVGTLTQQEVEKVCRYVDKVQKMTDDAAAEVQSTMLPLSPSQYGTAVHTRVEKAVREEKIGFDKNDPTSYQKVWSERSYLKAHEEDENRKAKERAAGQGGAIGSQSPHPPDRDPRGVAGTIRIDVFEDVDLKTACVEDIKTGESELSPAHMGEMALRVGARLGPRAHIIVFEVRPTLPRRLR